MHAQYFALVNLNLKFLFCPNASFSLLLIFFVEVNVSSLGPRHSGQPRCIRLHPPGLWQPGHLGPQHPPLQPPVAVSDLRLRPRVHSQPRCPAPASAAVLRTLSSRHQSFLQSNLNHSFHFMQGEISKSILLWSTKVWNFNFVLKPVSLSL